MWVRMSALRPFLGRYQLQAKLATAGMAEIYLAQVSGSDGFEQQVVVKRILPRLAANEKYSTMFLNEAKLVSGLQHPNIVQVYDACEDGGECFIAMEHLDGLDLRALRQVLAEQSQPMPWEQTIYIAMSIASGLHFAHERGVIHRDISPDNVVLTRNGDVKLIDFGIALYLADTQANEGAKGKLGYMSPEQCGGGPIDRRSDIYSLGVIIYELTCGRRLYTSRTKFERMKEIVEGEVTLPSTFMTYPADLESILIKCLAKDPEERYPSAQHVLMDLERFSLRHKLNSSAASMTTFLGPYIEISKLKAANTQTEIETLPQILSPEANEIDHIIQEFLKAEKERSSPGWSPEGQTRQVSLEALERMRAEQEQYAEPRLARGSIPHDYNMVSTHVVRRVSIPDEVELDPSDWDEVTPVPQPLIEFTTPETTKPETHFFQASKQRHRNSGVTPVEPMPTVEVSEPVNNNSVTINRRFLVLLVILVVVSLAAAGYTILTNFTSFDIANFF
jgi:serine/threonine protein kinase